MSRKEFKEGDIVRFKNKNFCAEMCRVEAIDIGYREWDPLSDTYVETGYGLMLSIDRQGTFGWYDSKHIEKIPPLQLKKLPKQKCYFCNKEVTLIEGEIDEPIFACSKHKNEIARQNKFFTKQFKLPRTKKIGNAIPSSRNFGVEIEVVSNVKNINNEYNLRKLSYMLKDRDLHIERDGSLNDHGVEIVTHPKNGTDGELLINEISETLSKLNIGTDDSCGLHVHLEANDFDRKEFKKLLLFYYLFEDVLSSFVPAWRRGFNYARSIKRSFTLREILKIDSLEAFEKTLYRAEDDEYLESIKCVKRGNDSRYMYANLHSIYYRGTVEIRSHEGTTDKQTILNWVALHAKILDALVGKSSQEIIDLYKSSAKETLNKSSKRKVKQATQCLFDFISLPENLREYYTKRQNKFGITITQKSNDHSPNMFSRITHTAQGRFRNGIPLFRPMTMEEMQQQQVQMTSSNLVDILRGGVTIDDN